MTSLPEQLSAARKTQLETQFDFFRVLTSQAFDNAGKVIALNLSTSRATVERSTRTIGQMFSINDPRDLFAIGSQAQEQFQSMIAYGRELFNIAASARLNLPRPATAPVLPAPSAAPVPVAAVAAPVPAAAAAPLKEETAVEEIAKANLKPAVVTEPAPVEDPVAKAKPVAEALNKVAPQPAAAEHPAAAPLAVSGQQEIALPKVNPVDAAPPVPEIKRPVQPKAGRKK